MIAPSFEQVFFSLSRYSTQDLYYVLYGSVFYDATWVNYYNVQFKMQAIVCNIQYCASWYPTYK